MRWLRGNRQADRRLEFEVLVEPLLRQLYHTARNYTRDSADAEDLVQDAILRAYRAFDEFEPGTNFKAWVFRILTNLCINHHRRREHGPQQLAYDEIEREAELTASAGQSPAALPVPALFEQVMDEDVEEAMGQLPVEFRTVVILADVQEFSYQEVASILGIPIGTVRSRLFRARRLLRAALTDYALARGLIRESDVA